MLLSKCFQISFICDFWSFPAENLQLFNSSTEKNRQELISLNISLLIGHLSSPFNCYFVDPVGQDLPISQLTITDPWHPGGCRVNSPSFYLRAVTGSVNCCTGGFLNDFLCLGGRITKGDLVWFSGGYYLVTIWWMNHEWLLSGYYLVTIISEWMEHEMGLGQRYIITWNTIFGGWTSMILRIAIFGTHH